MIKVKYFQLVQVAIIMRSRKVCDILQFFYKLHFREIENHKRAEEHLFDLQNNIFNNKTLLEVSLFISFHVANLKPFAKNRVTNQQAI